MAAGEGSVVMAGRLAIGITARALLAALAMVVAALAQPAPHGLRERDLIARGTPVLTVDGLTVFHSPGSEPEARAYGRTVADAARWFRAHTAWDGPLVMAVLDADDWAQLVTLPYPVPHAEIIGSMVVMPKDISGFPGFGDWSLDARRLNLALTVHELGHIIMRGQGVLPGNHWIDELMANVVMAAYVRAHPGDLDFILAGPPEGFANPARSASLSTSTISMPAAGWRTMRGSSSDWRGSPVTSPPRSRSGTWSPRLQRRFPSRRRASATRSRRRWRSWTPSRRARRRWSPTWPATAPRHG